MITSMAFTMYPVTDIARARRFHEQDLGLTVSRVFQDAWIEYDLAGGAFVITTLAEGVSPAPMPVAGSDSMPKRGCHGDDTSRQGNDRQA